MTQKTTEAADATGTVEARVTLTVAPKEGQSTTAAAVEMLELFREYLTSREHPFLSDYGTTREELATYRDDGEQPTWGGYEGPFVLDVKIHEIGPDSKGAA